MPKDLIIHDTTPNDILFPKEFGRGLVPRDYSVDPPEMFAPPSEIKLIPRSEWDARIDEQEQQKSSLEHIRDIGNNGQRIPSLNQTQSNFCWAHSSTGAVILRRAVMGLPYVPLSAYAVACLINNYANQGGWCGLSAKFIRENGAPSQKYWPQGSFSRSNDTPEMRASMAQHKITLDWVDLTQPLYQQNLTFDMLGSLLLQNVPCPVDYSWWSHSVLGIRLVRIEAGSYGVKIWNSWGDDFGTNGLAVLQGQRAIPDSALGVQSVTASLA